jgi:pyruvate,water dikinase
MQRDSPRIAPKASDAALSTPIHEPGAPGTAWTTVNTGENFPGVATPLAWTFWREPLERALRGGFADMGVLRPSDIVFPRTPDERFCSIIFGRFVANVDQLRRVSDLIPGTSGSDTEAQFFGSVRPDVVDRPSVRRYPAVAAKLPRMLLVLPRRLELMRADTDRWWRDNVRPGAATGREVGLLREASARFERIMRAHTVSTMLASALHAQLAGLAESSGFEGRETVLMSGYGGIEESKAIADLWRLSREELDLNGFLYAHGYHAPVEAEIRSVAWREDPAPVLQRAQAYARLSAPPDEATERLRQARLRAEREVLASLPRVRRQGARLLLRLAERFIPTREVGKAAFLQVIDVARAAARSLAAELVRSGALDDPDDLYFLTMDEVTRRSGRLPEDYIALRRAEFDRYQTFGLPESWIGIPQPVVDNEETLQRTELTGIAICSGVVEGTARVVSGPDSDALGDGEILVCNTTDPSWTSLFPIAGALIIDVGGPISHGAIVAREMGIPCVVNTRDGTRVIRSGDRVRVDGGQGRVEIIERMTR